MQYSDALGMSHSELLQNVRDAQDDVQLKEASSQDGIGDRDKAIAEAQSGGVLVADIAQVCGMSRQQVHRILKNQAHLPENL